MICTIDLDVFPRTGPIVKEDALLSRDQLTGECERFGEPGHHGDCGDGLIVHLRTADMVVLRDPRDHEIAWRRLVGRMKDERLGHRGNHATSRPRTCHVRQRCVFWELEAMRTMVFALMTRFRRSRRARPRCPRAVQPQM